MSSRKEDALNEILTIAAEHGILTIIVNDDAPQLEISAPHSLAVKGKLRRRKVEAPDGLSPQTLHLEINFRQPVLWTSTGGFEKLRYWN
jgi:hypothetical protein